MAESKTEGRERTPALEWIASAIGAVLVAGILGTVLWEGFTGAGTPPDLAVEAVATRPSSAGYDVAIRIANHGGDTAAEVGVEGVLTAGGASETAETLFDFVPGDSERFGTLVFAGDPAAGELSLRITGYRDP